MQVKGRNMKKLGLAVALLLTAPAWGRAENADRTIHGQGYLFIGPIATSYGYEGGGLNTGFGGELLLTRDWGVGAELGYVGNSQGPLLGMGSIDFTNHFLAEKHRSRVEPFASGGLSLYFGERNVESGFNLGGGVNLWAAKHFGLRFEIRENLGISREEFAITHFAAFRIGVSFK